MKGKSLSRVRLLATPGTAAYQAPPSMGISRQESWSGLPLGLPCTGLGQARLSPGSETNVNYNLGQEARLTQKYGSDPEPVLV